MAKRYHVVAEGIDEVIEANGPKMAINSLFCRKYVSIENGNIYNHNFAIMIVDENGMEHGCRYFDVRVVPDRLHIPKDGRLYKLAPVLSYVKKDNDKLFILTKAKLMDLCRVFESNGGTVLMGKDIDDYLKDQNIGALVVDKSTIMFSSTPYRYEVYKAFEIAKLYRSNDTSYNGEDRTRCEAVALTNLLSQGARKGFCEREKQQLRKELDKCTKSKKETLGMRVLNSIRLGDGTLIKASYSSTKLDRLKIGDTILDSDNREHTVLSIGTFTKNNRIMNIHVSGNFSSSTACVEIRQ